MNWITGLYTDCANGIGRGGICVVIKILLLPFSILYILLFFAVKFSGELKKKRLSVPVVSVGNITWGGTGKTPVVNELVRYVLKRGKKPVVLIRGYGNDENKLIEWKNKGVTVLSGKDRYRNAVNYLKNNKCDIFILDDGFQHWKIERDLDIVLLDSKRPFGNSFPIPSGNMREPFSGLKRADIIIFSNFDERENFTGIWKEKILKINPGARFAKATHSPLYFYSPSDIEKRMNLKEFENVEAFAFSGIGRPDNFFNMLKNILDLRGTLSFRDHYDYSEKDVEKINRLSRGRYVFTTEKDYFRNKELLGKINSLYILTVKLEFLGGADEIFSGMDKLLCR